MVRGSSSSRGNRFFFSFTKCRDRHAVPSVPGLKLTSADERRREGGETTGAWPSWRGPGARPYCICICISQRYHYLATVHKLTLSDHPQVTPQLKVSICDLVWRFVAPPPLLGSPMNIFLPGPEPALRSPKVPTHLHLLPLLRRSGTISLRPLYAFAVPVIIFEVHCTLSQFSICDCAVRSVQKNYF